MAAGPSASAAAFCATPRISPVEGLITTIIALRHWVSTACWAAFCTDAVQRDRDRRRRLGGDLVEDVDVGAVLVDADDPPAGLAVEFVDHRLLDLADDGRGEGVVGGQQVGLRGDHDTGQRVEHRAHLVVVGRAKGDQLERVARRTGLLGQPLRVECVVELAQQVGDHPGGRHQIAAGLGGVELVAVEVAGHQHIGAAQLVDRRPPRRVGPQREASGARRAWGAGRWPPSGPASRLRRGSCSARRRRSSVRFFGSCQVKR